MTVIRQGAFDDVVELVALHAHRRQAGRQGKSRIHVGDGFSSSTLAERK